ncbi:MAG: hypothetical protein EOP49_30100 [Sphingobacteriales bacterium]|nr:MAG: hypothetical protein EOP49_30100 [Sphingobacteriales bacterium]
MKKYMLAAAVLVAIGSCGKKNKFTCTVATMDKPAGDSAVLFVPNAFSPNEDGLNDRFYIQGLGVSSIAWSVYDQENKLVFSAGSMTEYWEPHTTFPQGMTTYHYTLEAVTELGNKISRCGDFYAYTCVPENFSMKDITFGDQYNPGAPEYISPASHEVFRKCSE